MAKIHGAEYRDRAPIGLNRHFRDLGVEVEGRVFPTPNRSYSNAITPIMEQQMAVYQESQELEWDCNSQIMAMSLPTTLRTNAPCGPAAHDYCVIFHAVLPESKPLLEGRGHHAHRYFNQGGGVIGG